LNGVDHAREFHQRAVAHQFHGAPAILGFLWFDEFPAQRLEGCKGASLVLAHEAAVPDDIRSKNGGEAALQGCFPSDGRLAEDQVRIYVWIKGSNVRFWL